MRGVLKLTLVIAVLATSAARVSAQLPPGGPPRAEKPEPSALVEKQFQDVRKSAEAARAANAKKTTSSKSRSAEIRTMAFMDDSARLNRPLIVKNGKMDAKVREQLKEDLLVMSRIIEKAAREHLSDVHKAAGIDLLALGGGNRSVRTMYLDEYGVLFTLNVRTPLKSENAPEETEVKEAIVNEEWEEAKNELGIGQRRKARRPVIANLPKYDEEDVKQLKDELLDALTNAANIRNLKPTDWITIAVSGPARVEGEIIHVSRSDEDSKGEKTERSDRQERYAAAPKMDVLALGDGEAVSDSTMVLRVRKSELDAVVKKEVATEELPREIGKVANVQVY